MTSHRIEYDGGAFCVWTYNGPWHCDYPLWAYALRATGGVTFWETARAKGGFASEDEAVQAAREVLAQRHTGATS